MGVSKDPALHLLKKKKLFWKNETLQKRKSTEKKHEHSKFTSLYISLKKVKYKHFAVLNFCISLMQYAS